MLGCTDPGTTDPGTAEELKSNDQILGGTGRDCMFGGQGADAVIGEEGDDVLCGNDGDDLLDGDDDDSSSPDGDDILDGGGDDDTLFGRGAGDSMHGGAGADVMNGNAGDDRVFGGDGDDVIWGGPGHDHLWGGYGDDYLDVKPRPAFNGFPADPAQWFTNGEPDNFQGADSIYGGWDQDALQADTPDIGLVTGDRLMDWVGSYNVYFLCKAASGTYAVVDDLSPDVRAFLKALAEGDGATDPGMAGTSGFREVAIVFPGDTGLNTNPSHPDSLSHFTCGDIDRDGCTDVMENGPDEHLGGRRDTLYFWDFYDVWTRPSGDPAGWERNKAVNIVDVLMVTRRFGPGTVLTKDAALAAALTPPIDETGYHPAYDRGPMIGPNAWDAGPPDGTINITDDILGVAGQFGHICDSSTP